MLKALRPLDCWGKPIIACVTGKEFALADATLMETAGISVFSVRRKQVVDALAIMFRHQKWTKSMGRRAEPSAKMVEHSLEVCVGGS